MIGRVKTRFFRTLMAYYFSFFPAILIASPETVDILQAEDSLPQLYYLSPVFPYIYRVMRKESLI